MFIRNEWYVASWSKNLGRTLLARTICDEPILLYRREDGGVAALEDVCPHRLLPLSMGFLEGDAVRCLYHGLLLGPEGNCREMPGGGAPNRSICAKTYPVVERHGFVWVWIGDPALADEAKLPNLWMIGRPGWRADGGVMTVACDYRLLVDNLMDLTHETYVHANSVGQKELHDYPIVTTSAGREVVSARWMPSVPPPPLYRASLGDYDAPVDRWQVCRFLPPTGVVIDVGVSTTARGNTLEDHENADVRSFVLNFATPATAKSCTYFWGSARSNDIDDDARFEAVTRIQESIFLEDVAVLEAQQRQIDRLPGRKLQAFAVDAGGVRARLMLERMLKEQVIAI